MSSINSNHSASPWQENLSFISIDSKATQACESLERFQQSSKQNKKPYPIKSITPKQPINVTIKVLSNIFNDDTTTRKDKLHQIIALHSKWKYEDVKKVVKGGELLDRQRQ